MLLRFSHYYTRVIRTVMGLLSKWYTYICPSGHHEIGKLLNCVSGAFAIRFLGSLLSLACQVYAARSLGLTKYGGFAYWLSLLHLLGFLSRLGVEGVCVKFASSYLAKKDWSRLSGLYRASLGASVILSCVVCSLALLIYYSLSSQMTEGMFQRVALSCLALPLINIMLVLQGITRGLNKVGLSLVPNSVLQPFIFLISLAAISSTKGGVLSSFEVWFAIL